MKIDRLSVISVEEKSHSNRKGNRAKSTSSCLDTIDVEDWRSSENDRNRATFSVDNVKHANYWSFLHIVSILSIFSLLGSSIFLIPRHNSIFYPEHWYEVYFVAAFFALASAFNLLLNCSVFMQEVCLKSMQLVCKIWSWNMVNYLVMHSLLSIIWVWYFEYNHPMPFIGLIQLPLWVTLLAGMWFLFPSRLLANQDFRTKLKIYVLYSMWWFVMNVQKDILSIIFKIVPIYIQWLFAIFIPIIKEKNKQLLVKLVNKMAGKENEASNVLLSMNINVHYALFIAIRLTGAHVFTVICMVLIDFTLHTKITYGIIKLQKKIITDQNEIERREIINRKAILKLVLAEMCEGLVPLAYAITVSMIHYGPNSTILGESVENNKKIEDMGKIFGVMAILFSVDTLSSLLNASLLWHFGKISLGKEVCRVLNQYWHFLLIQLSLNIFVLMISKDINNGMDWSMSFKWITNEGRIMLICNSTDLSDVEKSTLVFNLTKS